MPFYPATIVGMPPMEEFYIGDVPQRRDETLPAIFKMNFPKSWTSRCPPKASSTTSSS